MTAEVISLPIKPKLVAVEQPERFYCLRCEGEVFTLFANGMIRCNQCNSSMGNLKVVKS